MHDSIAYLFALQKFGMKFGLRNIRALLRESGDPHRTFPSVHVAGTNGKGSTASMIAAILTAAGYRVGLYTSPHLVRFNERIRISGREIADRDVVRLVRLLRPAIDRHRATFFEATTAMAFRYFSEQKVDIAVIETGLGGRLDSTNVITPLVSVITSIGLDHREQLGETLLEIAGEKAGIIKRGVPAVLGPVRPPVQRLFRRTARQRNAPLLLAERFRLGRGMEPELSGRHQRSNAKCAVAAVTLLPDRFIIGDEAVRRGLADTSELSGLRARLERLSDEPRIIIDVAHNPDGISPLVRSLRNAPAPVTIVFGAMRDKDVRGMLLRLKRLRPHIIACSAEGERAMPSGEVSSLCRSLSIPAYDGGTVPQAVRTALRRNRRRGTVIITGSHMVAGAALTVLPG